MIGWFVKPCYVIGQTDSKSQDKNELQPMALCKNMTMLKFFRNSIDSLHVEMDYISKFLYWVRIKLPKWDHFLFSETSEAGSHKLFDFSIFKNIQLTWPLWIFSQKFIRDKLFHGRSLTIHPQLSWLDGKNSVRIKQMGLSQK